MKKFLFLTLLIFIAGCGSEYGVSQKGVSICLRRSNEASNKYTAENIYKRCLKNIDRDIISDVKVFDNYENENLRAIALEVIIQSDSKTLSENEINELSTKIISQAKTQFNAKLR